MSEIEVKEKTVPRVTCPHCKRVMAIDIMPFQQDVTKVIESNCPFCYKKLFTAMTILTHKNLNGLMETLHAMHIAVQTVDRAGMNKNAIDNALKVHKKTGGN
jgi:hypothetical protein